MSCLAQGKKTLCEVSLSSIYNCVITVVNKVVSTVTCALQCFCFEVM